MIAEVIQRDFPGQCFSSITLVKNSIMPPHRDIFNSKIYGNLVSPLKVTPQSAIWEELQPGDPFYGRFQEKEINGKAYPGQLPSLERPLRINPSRWHAAEKGEAGDRVLLVAYAVSKWEKLSQAQRTRLDKMGFNLPMVQEVEDEEAVVAHLTHAADGGEITYPLEESLTEIDDEITMCAKASVENLYAHNIEELLGSLDGDLRVVHTVDPKEVEKSLQTWIPSLENEIGALESMSAVTRLRGEAAKSYLATGVTVVPGKVVFTVKSPAEEGKGFKRKNRIVGCGNFQQKQEGENNYSGGAAAEAVRFAAAEAAQCQWALANGEIKNAFLRAPIPKGTMLALRPPAMVVRAGLATPDEIWRMDRGLYGFRTSPRWWGTYRNSVLKEAKIGPRGLWLQQIVGDPNMWQVKCGSGNGSRVGLLVVYVDDILVVGPEDVCREVYDWISNTWEASDLEFAEPDHAIRFLGMEIRKLVNSRGE